MLRTPLLCSVALTVLFAAAPVVGAEENESAVPKFMSADFGWQPGGFELQAIPGKVGPVGTSRNPADSEVLERIGDANNPNLTPWAAAQMRINNDLVRNGRRAFTAQSRCWPGGTPGQMVFVAEPVYFVQTAQEVWIIWQRNQWVRRIYLNREHSANPKPSWFGESVGRYENGELVIDTIGFIEHQYSFVDNNTTPHTKDLHVMERWKLVDGGRGLQATVTVEDPGAFKAPWSGTAHWQRVNRAMTELICAENNLNYEQFFKLNEYPMPQAKTADF